MAEGRADSASRGRRGQRARDPRAVAPATSKLLEVALVVLYVGVVSTALYGGAVPGYEAAAGEEMAERTLATASQRVQQAVPPNGSHVRASASVALPDAIRGRSYAIRADGRRLVLEHPDPAVGDAARLALPDAVVAVTGHWTSTAPARVVVEGRPQGLHVALRRGRR